MSHGHDGYHGQAYVEGEQAKDAPDQEGTRGGLLRDPGPGQDISVYSHVEMQGNFGFGCTQQQHITLRSVTLAQAQKAKWDYFGLCPSQMTCYDENGKPVHEE
jgi:hypothetical protein